MWRSCNSDDQAWQSREAHVVSKHVLYDWTTNTPIATATGERGVRIVPATPQNYGVHAFFEKPFEVYNGCEVFAFEVEVEVDGVRGKHVLPFDVEREFDADE